MARVAHLEMTARDAALDMMKRYGRSARKRAKEREYKGSTEDTITFWREVGKLILAETLRQSMEARNGSA